jgi:intein/homing endonuclease
VPIKKQVNKDFFKKWGPDMAYVLGFFMADGTITVNKNGVSYFAIQIADKDLLYEIRNVMQSEHKITKRIHKRDRSVFYRIQIGRKDICDDLRKLIIADLKTHRMLIPKVPKKYIGGFVRGYFDGDGNVWKGFVHKSRKNPLYTLNTVFTSCSEKFLKGLQGVLAIRGLSGSLYKRRGYNVYKLQYSKRSSLLLYSIMYDNLSETDLFLKRKKKVFDEYINMRT